MARKSRLKRSTLETEIELELALDGKGNYQIETGIPFFDHMLAQLAKHGGLDLKLAASGDLEVDLHHTVEDTGIVLGRAVKEALGDRRGIQRYASALLPMDDVLCRVVLDISSRPYLYSDLAFSSEFVGQFPVELVEEFLRSFAFNAGITLHVELLHGSNTHHQVEAVFKALGRCLKLAVRLNSDQIPSTKGVL